MTDMLSSGNGAFSWNSTMSGRHDTCGMTRTPRACSAADCSRTARCPSGPSMPPRSAVQLTGRCVRSWIAANWSRKRPGPMVACMTPPAASARQAARVAHQAAHLPELVVRRLALGRLLAHDVEAHGRVAHERAHVDRGPAPLDRGQELTERLERPLAADPGAQRLERHALHALERAEHEVAVRRARGCDAEAAVPHHH